MDGPTLTLFLVQIGLVLAIPLCMAKLLQRLALSLLVVELLCGVLLGPSVFGMLAPQLFAQVFPTLGRATQAREAVTELGLLLFVFMAGLELQPKRLRTLGLPIYWTSFLGILAPLVLGVDRSCCGRSSGATRRRAMCRCWRSSLGPFCPSRLCR
jgi:Kef-type K+ transport system membrane component KefB